jgi:hypothetical protein
MDLREAIIVALSTFENSYIDPNMALQDRLIAIRKRTQPVHTENLDNSLNTISTLNNDINDITLMIQINNSTQSGNVSIVFSYPRYSIVTISG